eukprot:TRINITY_DN1056_c0_g1_i1.p3 TRINITY_DN1056_c0_g1~~TRINITY_DN1056_c0_g1_i1.p3  ORF type:complete len:127 (-),score=38.29 TRINITY_DN1056_c0_g1_i1:60-440(-)
MIALLVLALVAAASASCWSAVPYHLAAKAFAEGTGNVTSQSACKYGSLPQLNSVCPTACLTLLKATWGDCYCNDQAYQPSVSNPFIAGLTVEQIYEVLAGSFGGFQGANCRQYLAQPATQSKWRCL